MPGSRGRPCTIRCDNGPEYVSELLATWAEKRGIGLQFIQPGKPQQNAYVERYNRTVRYDWLNQYIFEEIEEVQEAATAWLWTYNNEWPNMAIGGITLKQKIGMGYLYIDRDLDQTAAMFSLYLVLSVLGYVAWKKNYVLQDRQITA